MKLLKVLLIASVMFSGIIVPQNPSDDDSTPVLYCYGSDCTEFW